MMMYEYTPGKIDMDGTNGCSRGPDESVGIGLQHFGRNKSHDSVDKPPAVPKTP